MTTKIGELMNALRYRLVMKTFNETQQTILDHILRLYDDGLEDALSTLVSLLLENMECTCFDSQILLKQKMELVTSAYTL